MGVRKRHPFALLVGLVVPVSIGFAPSLVSSAPSGFDPGIGNVPQGTQSNQHYSDSFGANKVTNVFVTTQQVSCYRPEAPYSVSNGPNDGYTGELPCPGANTGENTGGSGKDLTYPTQVGSQPPYPAAGPMLATDHSESDIRVDPTNPNHLIGSTKWFSSPEGYNHLIGFFESFDGGKNWPTMGHVPGYEGFTDNTDPVGAFDAWGNYYQALLPYQFFYDATGHKKYEVGNEPNPAIPSEAVAVAVRKHGATAVADWITTHNGQPDYVFTTNAGLGQEPDKEWIAIDRTIRFDGSRNYNRVYMMYVNFNGHGSKPYVQTANAFQDGTHSDWTPAIQLPNQNSTNNDTYLLPHVDPNGVVYTPLINYDSEQSGCCVDVLMDYSTDGGVTWVGPSIAASNIHVPPLTGAGYLNTTFEDGIEETSAVGNHPVNGNYPVYIAYESKSTGFGNILLTATYDQGNTWTVPIQVNDNASTAVDEFQPNLAVAPDGTVSVNFYDRRLSCPASGTSQAAAAGLALDQSNPSYGNGQGPLPPYGFSDYCINSSIQFYSANLTPIGHNIRLTAHTWDPQLNSPDRRCSCNPTDTFLGDYFGNDVAGTIDYSTFVSTYDDGTNPHHYQQQVFASIAIPRQ